MNTAFANRNTANSSISRCGGRLLAFTRPYKGAVFTLCAANMLLALGETIFPLFTRYAIDALARGSSAGQMGVFFAGMLALAVLLSGCTFVFIRRAGHIEQYVSYDIRKACFDRLQTLSFSYYDRTPVGYIMARMTGDTPCAFPKPSPGRWWTCCGPSRVSWAPPLPCSRSAPPSRCGVLIVLPPLAACTLYFQRKIFQGAARGARTNSRITGAYNESIMGATTTKSLTREAENLREFSDITDTMCRASCKAAHSQRHLQSAGHDDGQHRHGAGAVAGRRAGARRRIVVWHHRRICQLYHAVF